MVTICYNVTNGYIFYSHRYTGLPKSTPNVKCPRLRLYVLEASREGQEKVVEQVGRPGTPWEALGGPGRPWGLESLGQAVADAAGSGSGSQKSGLCCA